MATTITSNEAEVEAEIELGEKTSDEELSNSDDSEDEKNLGDKLQGVFISDEAKMGSERGPGDRKGLKVLFLSSDTGGGHRASAESLGKQFQLLFPGTTYDLLDVVEKDGVAPYNSLVSYYKHLSGHPSQWKLVYSVSNSRAFELLADAHLKLMCERAVRRSIQSYDPDVVVSVHPLMTNVPVLSCSKISQKTGKHLPIFTVVTDLGSAHCLWFANGVEKMFVGSEKVRELAKSRGKVPDEKLVLAGLPIRHDFAIQAELLGDRFSEAGRAYQRGVREKLGIANNNNDDDVDNSQTSRTTILLMGGGEGVGSLGNITDALYVELVSQGIPANVLVVCGRNEKLQTSLQERDWTSVIAQHRAVKDAAQAGSSIMSMTLSDACTGVGGSGVSRTTAGCADGVVAGQIRRILTKGNLGNAVHFPVAPVLPVEEEDNVDVEEKKAEMEQATMELENSVADEPVSSIENSNSIELVESLEGKPGTVTVVGLGFVENMAEYMVAADILVSKAGPGTISEAAAVSLPVMLTSYLPGQEEGNVDYVIDNGFGAYCPDSDPIGIAEEICMWLKEEDKLPSLSKAAGAKGAPHAARDIAKSIGESTIKWVDLNDEKAAAAAASKTV